MRPNVVLVTGALSSNGRAVARRFAADGARVVVSDSDRVAGDELADALCATGAQVEFRSADLASEAQLAALMRTTVERFGRIDIAVNAPDRSLSLQTVALSTFLCLKHELTAIRPNERGSIVNVLPVAPAAGHALAGLTKSAALETAACGIRVNAVAPAASDAPDEVARIVAFLASDRASFITGSIFGAAG